MKIRWKILFLIAALFTLYLSIDFWIMRQHQREATEELSRQYFNVAAESTRSHILDLMRYGADGAALAEKYKELKKNIPYITDLQVIHIPEQLKQPDRLNDTEKNHDKTDPGNKLNHEPSISMIKKNNLELIHYEYPIYSDKTCLKCHAVKAGQWLGTLTITMNINQAVEKARLKRKTLQYIQIGQIMFMLFLLILALNYLIFKPMDKVSEGAKRIAAGDYKSPVPGESGDEIGILVSSFNNMTEKIRGLIDNQESIIKDRTKKLTLLLETSNALNGSLILNDVLEMFAHNLSRSANVSYSRIVFIDEKGKSFIIMASFSARKLPDFKKSNLYKINYCPTIWKVIKDKTCKQFNRESKITEEEKKLLYLIEAQVVLCLPIIQSSEVMGFVVLGEIRPKKREPLGKQKIDFSQAMVDQLGAAIKNARLHEDLIIQTRETVLAMADAVDKKSSWTAGHSKRVTEYAITIANEMEIPKKELEILRVSAMLHDIGKIGTPGKILDKPGMLQNEEYEIIKHHPIDGEEALSRLSQFKPILKVIRHHHEWFNGNGYPDGLKGDDIPLHSRILSVADAFDAMIADRPYRKGLTQKEACSRLNEGAGTQFDPGVVKIFIKWFSQAEHNSNSRAVVYDYGKYKQKAIRS